LGEFGEAESVVVAVKCGDGQDSENAAGQKRAQGVHDRSAAVGQDRFEFVLDGMDEVFDPPRLVRRR
jgi:hypothetical protein